MPIPGSENTIGRALARASWVLFIVMFGVSAAGRVAGFGVPTDVVALLLLLAGFGCGTVSLFFISSQGRKGILIPALIGLILNGLFLLVWATNFLAALEKSEGA